MKSTAAGVLSFILLLPLLFVAVISPSSQQASQPATSDTVPGVGGGLNTSKVPPQYVAILEQAGKTCADYPPSLQAAQIEAESDWNPNASSGVAFGIAQFTAETAAHYGIDPMNPAQAIPAMAKMMCELYAQVKADMASHRITRGTATQNALAAYNCGEGCVEAAGGFPVGISETDAYVPRILALQAKYSAPLPVTTVGGDTKPDLSTNGPCPLGPSDTGVTCNQAIANSLAYAASSNGAWHDRCLNLVTLSWGGEYAGIGAPTYYAIQSAQAVQAAGLMQPPTTNFQSIPRGAIVWFMGPSGMGHVVTSVGGGAAVSTDVPGYGQIGVVSIGYFGDQWHEQMVGWSPPRV